MNFSVDLPSLKKGGIDIGVIFVTSDALADRQAFSRAYPFLSSVAPWLYESRAFSDFRAQKGEILTAYGGAADALPRLILTGLGSGKEFSLNTLRECAAKAARCCRELRLRAVAFFGENFTTPFDAPQAQDGKSFSPALLARETALGAMCGLYRYERFSRRSRETDRAPDPDLTFVAAGEATLPALGAAVAEALEDYSGIALARDLVTAPSNIMTPEAMAAEALAVADAHGFIYACHDQEQVRAMGMGAFAAVFQGTDRARLVVLEYAPKGYETADPLVVVGKGINFDAGGISLKPAAKMHEMKSDMAGGAAVLGLFRAIGEMAAQGAPLMGRVVGLVGCAENLPGPDAVKPGDVVRTFAGKTVEIQNTDAEGRLVLCDLLSYAQKNWHPAALVDMATLTGACIVALGKDVGGLFSDDAILRGDIEKNSCRNGERFWPLPLWDSYAAPLRKNGVADLCNMASREGAAIFAAVFLKQFINPGTSWAHLDIAGPAYVEKATPLSLSGGTGFGVRTLVDLCRSLFGMDKGR